MRKLKKLISVSLLLGLSAIIGFGATTITKQRGSPPVISEVANATSMFMATEGPPISTLNYIGTTASAKGTDAKIAINLALNASLGIERTRPPLAVSAGNFRQDPAAT